MWFQRSVCWMHGTSLSGVSFTRLSHCEEVTAPAVVGTSSTAMAQQSGAIQCSRRRDPLLTDIESPPLDDWRTHRSVPENPRRSAPTRTGSPIPPTRSGAVQILHLKQPPGYGTKRTGLPLAALRGGRQQLRAGALEHPALVFVGGPATAAREE